MTNWMTAAGIALIAGGLATLIGFRHALWGGGEDRSRERPARGPRRPESAARRAARVQRREAAGPRRTRRGAAVPAGVGVDDRGLGRAGGRDGTRDLGSEGERDRALGGERGRGLDGKRERGRDGRRDRGREGKRDGGWNAGRDGRREGGRGGRRAGGRDGELDGGLASLGLADEEPIDEALPAGALSAEALSGGVLRDEVLSGGVLRDEVLSGGVLRDEVLSGGVLRDEALPGGVLRDEVLSGRVLRDEVLPGGVLRGEVLSGGVLRDEVPSGGVVHDEGLPAEMLPDEVVVDRDSGGPAEDEPGPARLAATGFRAADLPAQAAGDGRRVLRAAMAEVRGRAGNAGPDRDEDVRAGARPVVIDAELPDMPVSRRDRREGPVSRADDPQEESGLSVVHGGGSPDTPGDLPPDVPFGRTGKPRDARAGEVTTAVPRMVREDPPPRRIAREGNRVDGWVRPDYRDQRQVTGDYWTPVTTGDDDGSDYGWPVPVERLPAVPPHPPASGFDLPPVNEPTAVVPQWPPARPSGRIEAPRAWRGADEEPRRDPDKNDRSWAERDRQSPPRWPLDPADPEPRDEEGSRRTDQPAWSRLGQRRRVSPVTEHIPVVADSTQMLPSVDGLVAEQPGTDRPRRRPRPRPRPQPADKSTVYVSKHAADPT